LPLSVGDRITIERRIDKFESRVEGQHEASRAANEEFYRTRMNPLEHAVLNNIRTVWFIAGVSVTSTVLVIALTVTVLLLHGY
jgi:hypothetical protein